MSTGLDNLWNLTIQGPQIDPDELGATLSGAIERKDLDFRTRLLIRDSLNALAGRWGREALLAWLASSRHPSLLQEIWESDLGPAGFPSLEHRLMEKTRPEHVLQFLRDLSDHVRRPTRLEIGGAIALILAGSLLRNTEDINVVNEVPPEIRLQHELLDRMASRYGLHLTHFQSHFLPTGWEARLHSLGRFGALDVLLVDSYDIFVGKLSSKRDKDLDDLRTLSHTFDKQAITARLRQGGASMLAELQLAENVARNWFVLYGEPLPS